MTATIDLNADVGESFGAWTMGHDEALMPHITSANIACGFHAGDPAIIEKTISLAIQHDVAIGAHPSLADLAGFGRRPMAISADEARQLVIYQAGAVRAFAEAAGSRLHHVKPHGALYNMAATDAALSKAIVSAVKALDDDLVLYVLAGSTTEKIARDAGLATACEVFADRRYEPDGTLVSRKNPHALITDEEESIAHVLRMVTQGQCKAIDESLIPIQADTVCLHGDQPDAVAFALRLRNALAEKNIMVQTV
jgi:5-oxoprolinase (ATP-hydrolysing) subunit A